MEVQKKSAFQAAIVPGVIASVVMFIYSLVLFLLDVDRESSLNYVAYLLLAVIIFWAMVQHRDKNLNGFSSYGQAFGIGFFTVLVSAVISIIFTYIFVTQIHPGLGEEILIQAEEDILARSPDIGDDEFEMAMSITEMFTTPLAMTAMAFTIQVIFGTILSLIIAIFAKREDTSVA